MPSGLIKPAVVRLGPKLRSDIFVPAVECPGLSTFGHAIRPPNGIIHAVTIVGKLDCFNREQLLVVRYNFVFNASRGIWSERRIRQFKLLAFLAGTGWLAESFYFNYDRLTTSKKCMASSVIKCRGGQGNTAWYLQKSPAELFCQ
jgi:hypothetical protein